MIQDIVQPRLLSLGGIALGGNGQEGWSYRLVAGFAL